MNQKCWIWLAQDGKCFESHYPKHKKILNNPSKMSRHTSHQQLLNISSEEEVNLKHFWCLMPLMTETEN